MDQYPSVTILKFMCMADHFSYGEIVQDIDVCFKICYEMVKIEEKRYFFTESTHFSKENWYVSNKLT